MVIAHILGHIICQVHHPFNVKYQQWVFCHSPQAGANVALIILGPVWYIAITCPKRKLLKINIYPLTKSSNDISKEAGPREEVNEEAIQVEVALMMIIEMSCWLFSKEKLNYLKLLWESQFFKLSFI